MSKDSRTVSLQFQEHIAKGEVDEALALAADDAAFIGPDGKVMDKAALKALFLSILPMMAGPFEQTIVGVTSEGERTAIQMTGSVPLKNGNTYRNRYHFLFIVRDGKIVEMTEYCDLTATKAFEG